MDTKRNIQGRWKRLLQALARVRNQHGYDILRWIQRWFHRLKRLISNATDFVCRDQHRTSLQETPLLTELPSYHNSYKTYLCSYIYEGKSWSVEIKAVSFEDAEKRLKALSRGKVDIELVATILIPIHEKWTTKIKKYLTQLK
jgi:hypothetical protein